MTDSEKRSELKDLYKVLNDWVQRKWERRKLELESGQWMPGKPGSIHEDVVEDAETVKPYLHHMLEHNSNLSADELEEIASKLSPGGAHDGSLLTRLIMESDLSSDPLLITAPMIRYNWHGGKIGFQFLPDPADDEDDYEYERERLTEIFDEALEGDPRRILTGEDRDFYLSLPERFTVYRGCAGISAELAGRGLCWTLKRDIAEWFALRNAELSKSRPVVVTARIRKRDIYFAKAIEQEIVALPNKSKQIAIRRQRLWDWSHVG